MGKRVIDYFTDEFPGAKWDRITSDFGLLFSLFNPKDFYGGIIKTILILEAHNRQLSTIGELDFVRRIGDLKSSMGAVQITELQNFFTEVAKSFPSAPLTHEQIVTEAIRLVHEVTGVPIDELNRIYSEGIKN